MIFLLSHILRRHHVDSRENMCHDRIRSGHSGSTWYIPNERRIQMKKVLGALLLPFLLWGGLRIYSNIVYKIDCSGHIKRAADSNTVELATQELRVVINYLEARRMTDGYTSALYRTPDEDVGFWYQNLKASLGELEKVTPAATQMERSNLLIKLRETLLDHGETSSTITEPDGISIFPSNRAYAWCGWLAGLLAIVALVRLFIELDA